MEHTIKTINQSNITNTWYIIMLGNCLGWNRIIYTCKSWDEVYRFKKITLDNNRMFNCKPIYVDEWVKYRNGEVNYLGKTCLAVKTIG